MSPIATLIMFVVAVMPLPIAAEQPGDTQAPPTAPIFATPPAPAPAAASQPERSTAPSIRYFATNRETSYRVEPVDAKRVRLAGWGSSGFTIRIVDGVTRITSEGEATMDSLRVDSLEMGFNERQVYLELTGRTLGTR